MMCFDDGQEFYVFVVIDAMVLENFTNLFWCARISVNGHKQVTNAFYNPPVLKANPQLVLYFDLEWVPDAWVRSVC